MVDYMSNFFNLVLDTTAPANPVISIENGATYASNAVVNAYLSAEGSVDKTNYQIKIWGNVDTTYNTNIKTDETSSIWFAWSPTVSVKLDATADGTKTLNFKIRDDVWNESTPVSDQIILDTAKPTVNIISIDANGNNKISKVSGKNVASIQFTVDVPFVEYFVAYVGTSGADNTVGQNGILGISTTPITAERSSISTNASATTLHDTKVDGTTFTTSTQAITVKINGLDLQNANTGDTTKTLKVFVRDQAGNWSV
jgi:hypothetical protein